MSRGELSVAGFMILLFVAVFFVSTWTVRGPRPDDGSGDLEVPGNAREGARLIELYGCGSCHRVPGVRGADGRVGPPLGGIAGRGYIAGSLVTTPANLARWIADPQGIEPGTAMPDLDLTQTEAQNVAAYLYSLEGLP